MANLGSVVLGEVTYPVQILVLKGSQAVEGLWSNYINLISVAEENKSLQRRLTVLESDNSRLREIEHEVSRLRMLLGAAESSNLTGVAADVVGYDPSNWIKAITVNKGSADGVRQGMAAIQGNYLVGKVIAVGRRTSQVLLLLDPTCGVDALIQSTRVRGIIEGNGSSALLQYVSPNETVNIGDRIVTSGIDGVFPKGLVVGVVSNVRANQGRQFQRIEVHPSVKFRSLESVLLVSGPLESLSAESNKEAKAK
jgi:rod shape-determining protein MreC